MFKLRPYQDEAIEAVKAELARQHRSGIPPSAILEAPTGAGKTAMASSMSLSATAKGSTVAFVCHRRELIDQTALTFERAGVEFGFIASGYERRDAPVQVCSVGTLVQRVEDIPAPNLLIIDECHHTGAKTWAKIKNAWASAWCVGLTATPCRLDGKGLGSWFNAIVPGPMIKDLMANKYLSYYDAWVPEGAPDMSKVKKLAGDYSKKHAESVLDVGEVLGNAPKHWRKYALGKKTVGFGITVKHCEHLVQAFRDDGIKAEVLNAKTPKAKRRTILRDFARGEFDVLYNVDLFGEGFDLSANSGLDVSIEAVILNRPTASLGLHRQQVGRALRYKDFPAVILDLSGNIERHGLPDDEIEWSLEDHESGGVEPGGKICKGCRAVIPRHVMKCPLCGTIVDAVVQERVIVEVEGDLQQIISGAASAEEMERALKKKRLEVMRAESRSQLEKIRVSRRLPEGWVEEVLRLRASGQSQRRR